jgi:hypothetical protein
MRWKMQKRAILEDDSVDLAVWIPSDHSDDTGDTERPKRAKGASSLRWSWFNLTNGPPGGRIYDHVSLEQFFCFEMAIGTDVFLWLNHLDQLTCEMRREFDHRAVIQQQTVNFAPWIEEILGNRAFHFRWERLLVGPAQPGPEFFFHFVSCFW